MALIWERRNGALIMLVPALTRPLWVATVEEARTTKITTEHKLVLELATGGFGTKILKNDGRMSTSG